MKDIKKQITITNKTRVLVIMPHPDDEAVFAAGLINHFSKSGARVNLVCMTNGEKSTHRYGITKKQHLGDIRKKELEQASRIMGVHTLVCANFPDGKLFDKHKDVSKFIVDDIIEYRPDIILTLEPDGIYGHPDHITLSRIIGVINESQKIPFTLIYATVPSGFQPSEGARKMANDDDINPLTPTHKLDLSMKQQYIKHHACMAHYTQLGENDSFWSLWGKSGLLEHEYFALA